MKNYGFEVSLNGKKLCSAGFDANHFATTTILTSARKVLDDEEDLSLYVGGLNSDEGKNYDWVTQILKKDDEILIKIIDDTFDEGTLKENELTEETIIKNKIAYYYRLKEELKEHINE